MRGWEKFKLSYFQICRLGSSREEECFAVTLKSLTVRVKRRNVGPVVSFDQVDHDLRLQKIRWNDPQKVFVVVFYAQIARSG